MLGGNEISITWDQFKESFYSFKPTTQTEALCQVVDMSTQGDDVQPKTLGMPTLSGQKRKAEQKLVEVSRAT
ncbi:uncharacterized protein E5676_scaffold120G002550 [Cucumis melo var. makuwa]|uniref:Gag-protease polyprotein n=1 Tax=Cucumis melo var. makuwa TaxID=1194695 RepID=A0A5A7UMI2_CUCMM|nr:uncharacterized protein E6C27_scaffold186G001530 [Cucumis melo var. makuwa]TYK29114.1 uncharacterized protein E5676_scaffold120G002550 [Cucumis melo var. makuwa]